MQGGTHIEILGRNLGVEATHIVQVTLGVNTPCDMVEYEAGRRYVCFWSINACVCTIHNHVCLNIGKCNLQNVFTEKIAPI